MPARCQAANCSNLPDKEKGITLHPIPFYNDERSEAKRRRKRWVDWVKLKRARWEPTIHSCVCSSHFTPESYERRIFTPGTIRRLITDEYGVAAFPTSNKTKDGDTGDNVVSNRTCRQVSLLCCYYFGYRPIHFSSYRYRHFRFKSSFFVQLIVQHLNSIRIVLIFQIIRDSLAQTPQPSTSTD